MGRKPNKKSHMAKRLKLLGFRTYADYLASPLWAASKSRWYQQREARPQCYICAKRSQLQLHHITYVRLGNEAHDDLVILCSGCHLRVHESVKAGEAKLSTAHVLLKRLRGAGVAKPRPTRVVRAKRRRQRGRLR